MWYLNCGTPKNYAQISINHRLKCFLIELEEKFCITQKNKKSEVDKVKLTCDLVPETFGFIIAPFHVFAI